MKLIRYEQYRTYLELSPVLAILGVFVTVSNFPSNLIFVTELGVSHFSGAL
jgi:hypothetical protein